MFTPVTVTDTSFDAEILKSDLVILACFCAEWNAACARMNPVLDEISQEYKNKVKVARLDIDENVNSASALMVLNIPTIVIFKNGQPIKHIEGNLQKDKLVRAFSGYLPQG